MTDTSKGVPVNERMKEELGIERDYSAEREERAVPLVHDLMRELGKSTVDTSDSQTGLSKSYDAFYEKFIVEAMEHNIRYSDLTYTFSLAKMSLEMLTEKATTPEDYVEKLLPVAQDLLVTLSNEPDLLLRQKDSSGRDTAYAELVHKIVLPLMEKHNVGIQYYVNVFTVASALIMEIENRVISTVGRAKEVAETRLWGNAESEDLTIKQIHLAAIGDYNGQVPPERKDKEGE